MHSNYKQCVFKGHNRSLTLVELQYVSLDLCWNDRLRKLLQEESEQTYG